MHDYGQHQTVFNELLACDPSMFFITFCRTTCRISDFTELTRIKGLDSFLFSNEECRGLPSPWNHATE